MHVERTDLGLIVESCSEDETDRLGRALGELMGSDTVVGLVGPLGSGKTRLVRAVAEALGVLPGAIASPTFVLIHEYEGRIPVYHFDVYRLKSWDEFEALGPADYWRRGGVCLVEWADRVAELLPDDSWRIQIEITGPTSRRFRFEFPEGSSSGARLIGSLKSNSAGSI
jgi:tRNA threonylcarbamoyladenosine biosynthesis protein TsaE